MPVTKTEARQPVGDHFATVGAPQAVSPPGRNCYLYVVCGIGGRTALLQRLGILTRIHI
jgi:hypothetical protein